VAGVENDSPDFFFTRAVTAAEYPSIHSSRRCVSGLASGAWAVFVGSLYILLKYRTVWTCEMRARHNPPHTSTTSFFLVMPHMPPAQKGHLCQYQYTCRWPQWHGPMPGTRRQQQQQDDDDSIGGTRVLFAFPWKRNHHYTCRPPDRWTTRSRRPLSWRPSFGGK
jgi:hypothetical protein